MRFHGASPSPERTAVGGCGPETRPACLGLGVPGLLWGLDKRPGVLFIWLVGRTREHQLQSGIAARADVGVMMLFWGILVSEQRSSKARGRDRGPLTPPPTPASLPYCSQPAPRKTGKEEGFFSEASLSTAMDVLVVLGTRKRVATLGI